MGVLRIFFLQICAAVLPSLANQTSSQGDVQNSNKSVPVTHFSAEDHEEPPSPVPQLACECPRNGFVKVSGHPSIYRCEAHHAVLVGHWQICQRFGPPCTHHPTIVHQECLARYQSGWYYDIDGKSFRLVQPRSLLPQLALLARGCEYVDAAISSQRVGNIICLSIGMTSIGNLFQMLARAVSFSLILGASLQIDRESMNPGLLHMLELHPAHTCGLSETEGGEQASSWAFRDGFVRLSPPDATILHQMVSAVQFDSVWLKQSENSLLAELINQVPRAVLHPFSLQPHDRSRLVGCVLNRIFGRTKAAAHLLSRRQLAPGNFLAIHIRTWDGEAEYFSKNYLHTTQHHLHKESPRDLCRAYLKVAERIAAKYGIRVLYLSSNSVAVHRECHEQSRLPLLSQNVSETPHTGRFAGACNNHTSCAGERVFEDAFVDFFRVLDARVVVRGSSSFGAMAAYISGKHCQKADDVSLSPLWQTFDGELALTGKHIVLAYCALNI